MRIAWLGPAPSDEPGVPTVGTLLIEGLCAAGIDVDVYAATGTMEISDRLRSLPRLRLYTRSQGWHWNRWYSRADVSLVTMLSEQATRARAQRRLVDELRARHRAVRYDAIYQFSQPELLILRHHLADLPPIVVHPQVHAAGELRWHRREADLSRPLEPAVRRRAARWILTARSHIQSRDLGLARAVVAPSATYAHLLQADCGLRAGRLHVVPNPVDLEFYAPAPVSTIRPEPRRILFVSRLSVRKGLELVVELSHRLSDLRGAVQIDVVGLPSQWSDYRGLLSQLNPSTATFVGSLCGADLRARYRTADLCLVPSHYEPFGLTAAEALACATPVVTSDAVGAVERVDAPCCERFPAGDGAAFEAAVRRMLARMTAEPAKTRESARSEAVSRFDHRSIGFQLANLLRATVGASR